MADGAAGDLGLYRSRRRAWLPLDDTFHVPRSLARVLRSGRFELRLNTAFDAVVAGCADRPETWISPELADIYGALHAVGRAHSVEAWDDQGLAGGQLGVSLGACWIGESMFHRRSHASNVVLVELQRALNTGGYQLYDVQIINPHLQRFGAGSSDDAAWMPRLRRAVAQPALLRIGAAAVVSEPWVAG